MAESETNVDCFVAVTRNGAGYEVLGQPAARVAHPWPRTPEESDVFAEWSWNGDTLTVRNDAWGFQPLFYAATSDRIVVSTWLPRLLQLGVPAALDDRAMAVFLRLSYFLGTDTPFKAIRSLPRHGLLKWRAGVLDVSSAVAPPTAQPLSAQSAIDAYVTLFRQAVRRRLPAEDQRAVVPLSGGRDSRLLLFQLVAEGCRPAEAVTIHHYPPKANEDARIAPAVAERAGVPSVVLPLARHRVEAERRKNVMTSFCADRHVQMLPLVDYLPGRADLIYDGLGGDVLSGARLERSAPSLALLASRRCGDVARTLLTEHSDEPALQALLHPDARRRFGFEIAEACVTDELARYVEWPNPYGAYRLANRTARSVALLPFGMLARACRVVTPFIDRDLTAFLMTLPISALANGRLRDDAIARAFPQYAHLPYEDAQAACGPAPGYYRRISWALAREALRRPNTPLVRRPFLASRLARSVATGRAPWFEGRRAIFLMQLEDVLACSWEERPQGQHSDLFNLGQDVRRAI